MNLVQINERLKDLPMQVIQQYANGMNPEVPPYLALGELQRREIAQKQMSNAQGAAQGPQPSVKEQVEQKAGLMAAQALQQQQLMQQMAQPRGPMPAPAGIPQPEAQPEAMARGGLAGIPVRRDMFEYAGGGIIAFQSGGKTPRIQDEVPISDEERERLRNELITRIVGEEARNPPVRRQPMEMTESDISTIPGLTESDLMARALAEAGGPRPDNRALLNKINARDARRTEVLEREAAKAASRPKYETSYDRMNRQNREPAPEARVINLPKGTSSQEAELVRMQNPDAKVVIEGQGDLLRSLAGQFQSGVEGVKKGLSDAFFYSSDAEAAKERQRPQASYSNEGRRAPAPSQAPYSNEGRQPPVGLPAALAKAGPAAPRPAAPMAGAAPMPGASRPAPQAGAPVAGPAVQAGLPAALPQGVSPFMAEAAAAAREKPVAPTPEGIIAEQGKLLPESMREEAMQKRFAEQRARAGARQEAFDKSRPTGLQDLIRVLGQAGQYKGMSGIAPAYTALQQQRRAEDLAMQKQQDELMTAIESREYEGGKALYEPRARSMDAANKAYQERLITNTKTLADLAGVDQRRMDEALNRLSQEKLERLRIAARAAEANRPGEAERIEARYAGLIAQGKTQEAEAYLDRISRIKGGSSAAGERNDIAAVKAEQSALQKELENLALPKDVRATKQKQLDDTYVKLRNLSGGGGQSQQAGKVVDFSSLPK